ncbi:MAG: M20/M25/M40 family metallo-hydrolase [Anaerolineales bacterium]|nr:M20/M25/M40 family metallo-hydrolase [Anaerolineales bacterium]
MINFDFLTEKTIENLVQLIRIDTTNPPGNELPAVIWIRDLLAREGIPAGDMVILESAPGRANLVARLRGDGSQPPLLLSGHVDVVPVEPKFWTHDPFGGEVVDGCVWGRGTADMKGFLSMYMSVFIQARQQGLPLKRDLILAAIADEEAGFEHGSQFLVEQHRDLIAAEYGLTESGGLTAYMGKKRVYPIQVAEKSVCWLRASTFGQPGHGSMPHEDNAVLHLAKALERLRRAGHLPIHLTPTVRRMLDSLAENLGFPLGVVLGLMRSPALAGVLLRMLPVEQRPLFIAWLSNSVSPTVLQAGSKSNVIPSEASVHLDCRLLPGQKPEDVIRELSAVMGRQVKLEPLTTSTGAEFPVDTPLYRLMEKALKQMDGEGITFPLLMPGATDASLYQRAGIKVYGFTPGILPPEISLTKMAHAHDERLPVSFFRSGLPALWQVVSEICCA